MSFDTLNSQLELFTDYGSGKFFLGKVYDNQDPLNLDRIRASVPGLYDPDLGETPWIGPVKFSPFGTGDTWGVYGTPAVGSNVLILLQDGDPHYPMYFSVQTKENTEFPSGECWGFQDPYGNVLKVTSTVIDLTTQDGVSITITEGKVTLNCPSDFTATAASFTLNGPVNINGAVGVSGNVSTTGTLKNNGVNVGSTHTHGGVTPGGGNTAIPH